MDPLALMDFLPLFEFIPSFSMFLVVQPLSFVGISISIDNFSISFDFIIVEIAIDDLVQALQLEFPFSLPFSF